MLVLTKKEYEIEEPIQLKNEKNEIIYEFTMRLTSEEVNEMRNLIFNENDIKIEKKLRSLKYGSEEYEKEYNSFVESAKERQERIEQLAFKEHRETFLKTAGQYQYDEMVNLIFDFFVQSFVEKRSQQINTMTTHLKKISSK